MLKNINFNFLKHRLESFLNRFLENVFKIKSKKEKMLYKNSKSGTQAGFDFSSLKWRGLHLDVARHFMPIDFLYEVIENMNKLNLNIFHLHLTDDQGWRFESKKYTKLNTISSKRKETVVGKSFKFFGLAYESDGISHSGYYTQEQLKDLNNFAKTKGITIVPEIDLPGHMTALLAAYPEYAHADQPKEVATYWGVFDNVLRADIKTFNFIKDIFDELLDVFDSKYIHIGGDEVHVNDYDKDFILDNIAQYLISKNRIPVLWDEALHIAKKHNGVVMAWQSMEDFERCLESGVSTICASSSHFYFDYYQKPDIENEPLAIGGYTPIEKVAESKKEIQNILNKISKEKSKNFLGAQAQMWTEYAPTPEHVSYMLFPRLGAFAHLFKHK